MSVETSRNSAERAARVAPGAEGQVHINLPTVVGIVVE
jgi:hypothetical protein